MRTDGQPGHRVTTVLPCAAVHAPLRARRNRARRSDGHGERPRVLDIGSGGACGGAIGDGNALVGGCCPVGLVAVGHRVRTDGQPGHRVAAVLPCAAVHAPLRARRNRARRFDGHGERPHGRERFVRPHVILSTCTVRPHSWNIHRTALALDVVSRRTYIVAGINTRRTGLQLEVGTAHEQRVTVDVPKTRIRTRRPLDI